MCLLEKTLQEWTDFLNDCFNFGSYGEKPLSRKGSITILLLIVIVSVPLLAYLASSPERLPGT